MVMESPEVATIPDDTFAVRLAVVRAWLGGLNVKAAAERCNIGPENWRRWEKGQQPHDVAQVARQIARATGVDYAWLMLGGPLKQMTTCTSLNPQVTASLVTSGVVGQMAWLDDDLEPLPGTTQRPVLAVAS